MLSERMQNAFNVVELLKGNAIVNNNTFKSQDLIKANIVQIGQGISEILAFDIFGTK